MQGRAPLLFYGLRSTVLIGVWVWLMTVEPSHFVTALPSTRDVESASWLGAFLAASKLLVFYLGCASSGLLLLVLMTAFRRGALGMESRRLSWESTSVSGDSEDLELSDVDGNSKESLVRQLEMAAVH